MSTIFYSGVEKKRPLQKTLGIFDALQGLTGFYLEKERIQRCCANICYTQNRLLQYNNQIYRMNLLNIHLRSKTYKYIFFQVFRNNRYHVSLLNNISIFSYLQVHGKMKNVKLFISLNIYCILLSQG